ncbi:MAG: hypothetical protein ACF8LK_08095 [Phycisphaerales bacterium JB041]
MSQSQRGTRSLRRRSFRAAGITLASVFSLLLWSRLKMVTDTPRMVYADPKSAETAGAEPLPGPETSPQDGPADRETTAADRADRGDSSDR